MEKTLVVHSDGGARGNPGPGACAFVVEQNNRVIGKGSGYLGNITNNLAEYQGVIFALSWILKNKDKLLFDGVICFVDSELVVRQLTGLYKVKNKNLKNLFQEVKKIVVGISPNIIFKYVPREENKLADFLVNKELDKNASGNFV